MMKALKMQQNLQESGDTPDDADTSDAGDPFAVDDSTYGKGRPGNPRAISRPVYILCYDTNSIYV